MRGLPHTGLRLNATLSTYSSMSQIFYQGLPEMQSAMPSGAPGGKFIKHGKRTARGTSTGIVPREYGYALPGPPAPAVLVGIAVRARRMAARTLMDDRPRQAGVT